MGKNKPNRTKNNAKPASSARSAELLENQQLTFFGFGTLKDGAVSMSMMPGVPSSAVEDIDANIDTNFQLALKKMSKKDATTKLKALQEFAELCKSSDTAGVKSVLPFWSRQYGQLCGDAEHRVREAAHISHKEVISKVKKHLAPYLKEIIGPWFSSQYDTYAPAASASRASFEEAFSPSKMAEAIAFCQEEILNYLQVNLIVHTPQSLATAKSSTPEELEEKYRRVVSSSLLGYASYLQKVSAEQIKNSEEGNKRILSSPKFWKLGQHKDPIIRHGFFSALLSLLQFAPWLISTDTQKVASSIFNHLSEDDPLVLPVLWDAALLSVTALPDCWKHSNVEKQLIPKLFNLLRSGGKGHASNIFPKILPILSELPAEKMGNKASFLEQLFSSMKAGLKQASVNRSQIESRVVAGTMIESLKFMVMVNREDSALVEVLVTEHLIGTLESYLSVPPSANLQSTWLPICHNVAQLLRSWYKNAPLYNDAVNTFWSHLEHVFQSTLEKEVTEENIETVLNNQTYFLATLKSPGKLAAIGASRRVKFAADGESGKPAKKTTESDLGVPEFETALESFVVAYTWRCIDKYTSSRCRHYLKAVKDLGLLFGENCLQVTAEKLNLFELFMNGLQKDIPQETLRGLGLLILARLEKEEEQLRLLEELAAGENLNVPDFCSDLFLSELGIVKIWIRKATFSEIFMKLVKGFVTNEMDSEAGNIIFRYLAPDPLVSADMCDKIIELFIDLLRNPLDVKLDRICLVLDAFGKKECIGDEFQNLLAKIFSVASEDGKIDSMDHLLRSALKKYKYAQNGNQEVMKCLASKLASALDPSKYVVQKTVSLVSGFIDVAVDVNLGESCEAEEIGDAAEFLKIFLQPSHRIEGCSATLKNVAMLSYEVNGVGDLKYFQLKKTTPSSDVEAENDSLLNYDGLLSYRLAHLSTTKKVEEENVSGFLQSYTNWLHFAVGLTQLFFAAYPICAKLEDIAVPNRYAVKGDTDCMEDDSDVIPRVVTPKEWEELKEEGQLNSAFDRDDFPDENFVIPLGNLILDVTHQVAILDSLLENNPEMDQHPVLSSECQLLKEELSEALATGTPKDFQFLYEVCKVLVDNDACWYAVQSNLSAILFRRFRSLTTADAEVIKSTVEEITDGQGLVGCAERVMILNAIIKTHAYCISMEEWNLIFIQMEKAIKALSITTNQEINLLQAAAISSFFVITRDSFLTHFKRADEERLSPELVQLWNDVVEKELWSSLFSHWRALLPILQPEPPTEESLGVGGSRPIVIGQFKQPLHAPILVKRFCDAIAAGLSLRPQATVKETMALAEICSYLLLSSFVSLQLLAFRVLLSLVPELVKEDNVIFQEDVADTPQNEDKAFFSRVRDCDWALKRLSPTLHIAQTVVAALLSDLKIGDTCTVQPCTDSFTYTHAYLLWWTVIIEMCGEAHVALRFQYASWLKNNNCLHMFFNSTFNLMPANVVHCSTARDTSALFEACNDVDFSKPASSEWIEQRACFLYRMCLQRLPAAVRAWWSEVDNVARSLIAKTTTQHVSPVLIAAELKAVQADFSQTENLTVTVTPVARTVVGSYGADEIQIILTLPLNHPLGLIELDMKTKTSFCQTQALRIFTFLVHRNGSIRDALAMWKSDMDKKFEGIEECEICFSILYGPNFELPKQACSTCRKKFHSACLYKWFHTSYKSSCPHCRNQF